MSRMFNRSSVHLVDNLLDSIINKKKMEIQSRFNEIDKPGLGYIRIQDFKQVLSDLGLNPEREDIEIILKEMECDGRIDLLEFTRLMTAAPTIVQKAINGDLAIPNFKEFCADMVTIYNETKKINDGELPNYIPELQKVAPDMFGIAFCTVDGQTFAHGDYKHDFSLQAAVLPLIYCIALEQNGEDKVHEFIGREPSGAPFAAFTLNSENKPHNPLISTGGIVACSLIQPTDDPSSRFGSVFDCISQMAGGSKIGFHQRIYLSEKAYADRNRALAYFMRGHGTPGLEGNRIHEVLEFYFQCCSIACNTKDMSIIAATLANGGKCPITNKRVLSSSAVRHCLSLLYSCGMYDYSGQWAFTVGLPSKSGISGCIMVIIPNVMGLCIYSPRVDKRGNSVRGIHFCRQLSAEFNFSIFDQLVGGVTSKVDPTVSRRAISHMAYF